MNRAVALGGKRVANPVHFEDNQIAACCMEIWQVSLVAFDLVVTPPGDAAGAGRPPMFLPG
jgi:hypothetical protein